MSPGPDGLCLRDTRIHDWQKFTITPLEKGDAIIHEIQCVGGTVWNVSGGSREPRGIIINYTNTRTAAYDNERFVFRHRDDGKYAIQCVESLFCVSVREHPNDGALIMQSKEEDKDLFYVQEWLDLIRKEQEKARAAAKQAALDKLSAQQQQIQQQLKDQNRRDQRQQRQKALQRADQKRANAEYQALQSETGVLVKARDSTHYRSSKALEKNRKKERHHWEDAGPTDSREQPKQNAAARSSPTKPRPRTSIHCLMR